MPHAIWNGAVTFGLISIPVAVLAATEDRSVRFHQYHLADYGRVRTRKVCELDNAEVRADQIGRGYETRGGALVEVTDADLDAIPLPTARAIEILGTVPAASIDPLRLATGYYLAAHGALAAKPYTLLRQALERSAKVAVVQYAWSGRERIGVLRVKQDAIVMMGMRWDDELRSTEGLAPLAVALGDDEVDAALELLDAMGDQGLREQRDHYRDALEELIRAKAAGGQVAAANARVMTAPVVDLMAALDASVAAAREQRGAAGGKPVRTRPKEDQGEGTPKRSSRSA
ncbi:Ku protein [Streptomyces sp. NPDC091201]|uniref:non-homologous end joining protein Ku n=1 Tax=Streptomyces sp. NPDC091201 TaxID=3155190 RepID=UPI00342305B7